MRLGEHMDTLSRINPFYEKYGHLPLVVFGIVLILLGLFIRTDFLLNIVNFILEILGWLGIAGGTATTAVGIAAYGNERGWWDKIIEANAQRGGRMPLFRGMSSSVLFLLVMAFFFLPWVSISCFGDEVTASGMDLMAITEGEGATLSDISPEGDYTIGDAVGSEAALIYLAFLLAVVGAVLFFMPNNKGRYTRAGIGAASVLFILIYMYLAMASVASDLGVGIGEIEEAGVEINWKIGLWLTFLGYLAAIALQFVPLPFAEDPPEKHT